MVTTVLCLLVALAVVFITALAQRVRASPTRVVPNVEAAVVAGAVINFFDTLGIGSFAPTTAYFKFRRLVPDRLIPATLIAASALPAITQALIFVRVIKVDPTLLVICITAAVLGSWLGSSFALALPARPIRLAMGTGLLIAAGLMTLGLWLHLTERHVHLHTHEPITHTHMHVHDEHHQHEHAAGQDPNEPHAHEHTHERLVHSHAHYPDIHHRHSHD